jgi:predicted alpha/beta-fold hydrolase
VLANPYLVQLVPEQGGHVGFLGTSNCGDPDDRWAENRLIQFFQILDDPASLEKEGIAP